MCELKKFLVFSDREQWVMFARNKEEVKNSLKNAENYEIKELEEVCK